jgi:hypothetical protein
MHVRRDKTAGFGQMDKPGIFVPCGLSGGLSYSPIAVKSSSLLVWLFRNDPFNSPCHAEIANDEKQVKPAQRK